MLSLLMVAAATAKVASDVATVKLITMGVSSAISVYVATRPRAYQQPRTSKKR
ncbi:MAG: hypothetical protein FWC91_02155 [Defluviitaleaceae bacterium]|nr:hypothetical protein [Defluviitaleaceae bacterium]